MTTIFIINAVGSALGALGIGGYAVWQKRQARKTQVKPLYIPSRSRPPR